MFLDELPLQNHLPDALFLPVDEIIEAGASIISSNFPDLFHLSV